MRCELCKKYKAVAWIRGHYVCKRCFILLKYDNKLRGDTPNHLKLTKTTKERFGIKWL